MKTAIIAAVTAIAALSASATVSAHEGAGLPRVHVTAPAATAGNAAYGEQYAGTTFEWVSTKTREQVKAEVLRARQRGELVDGEQYPQPVTGTGEQGKTRAQVRAELAAYRVANPDASSAYN